MRVSLCFTVLATHAAERTLRLADVVKNGNGWTNGGLFYAWLTSVGRCRSKP